MALSKKKRKEVVTRAKLIMQSNKFVRRAWLTASTEKRQKAEAKGGKAVKGTGPDAAFLMGQQAQLYGANQEVECSFCLEGAIYAAAGSCGLSRYDAEDLCREVSRLGLTSDAETKKAIYEKTGIDADHGAYATLSLIPSFNDSVARGKDDVLEVLERAEKELG